MYDINRLEGKIEMIKSYDNNMKLRNELNNLNDAVSKLYETYSSSEEQREYLLNSYYNITFTNKNRMFVESVYGNIYGEELKDYYINFYITKITLLSVIIINDLYVKLTHDCVTGELTEEKSKLLNMIVNAIEKNDTNLLLGNPKYISQFIEATCNFYEATAYEKIALLSSLDENDMKTLEKFNPFFKDEYDHYNVTLDEDFFIRQISKWLNGKNDLNVALEKTAEFIIDMCYTDSDKIDSFIDILATYTDNPNELDEALANSDIDAIKTALKAFYEERKNKTLKR